LFRRRTGAAGHAAAAAAAGGGGGGACDCVCAEHTVIAASPNYEKRLQGLVNVAQYGIGNPAFRNENQIKYHKAWQKARTNWKAPYDTVLYTHPSGNIGAYITSVYWLLSVVERAGSTDPEKVIKVWEDDVYQGPSGNVYKMRACDHKQIGLLTVQEYVPPAEQKQ
jgi:hypothetical protein